MQTTLLKYKLKTNKTGGRGTREGKGKRERERDTGKRLKGISDHADLHFFTYHRQLVPFNAGQCKRLYPQDTYLVVFFVVNPRKISFFEQIS